VILVGVGSNLSDDRHAGPRAVCESALAALAEMGVEVLACSPWYETSPVPASDQPWYVNGVVRIGTALAPVELLARLHAVEARFGRVRRVVNEARILDLDLLAYDGLLRDEAPVLPHPRLPDRAFVLYPLRDVAPGWRHPGSGLDIDAMIAALPPDQVTRRLP